MMLTLDEIWKRYGETLVTPKEHAPKDRFFMSELGFVKEGRLIGNPSSCVRASYWSFNHEKETNPPDETSQINFRMGDFFQYLALQILHKNGAKIIDIERPIKFTPTCLNHAISGRIDAVEIVKNEEILLEIKSYNSRWTAKKIENAREPMISHVLQLGFYLLATGIPWGKLVYINKIPDYKTKSYILTEFPVTCNGLTIEESLNTYQVASVINHLASIEEALLKKALPAPSFGADPKAFECRVCAYRERCFTIEEKQPLDKKSFKPFTINRQTVKRAVKDSE